MSTLALFGLLVVLLVAIGIAGFLLRGRRGASTDPDAPPRTVADLVDRRRSSDVTDADITDITDITDATDATDADVTDADVTAEAAGETADPDDRAAVATSAGAAGVAAGTIIEPPTGPVVAADTAGGPREADGERGPGEPGADTGPLGGTTAARRAGPDPAAPDADPLPGTPGGADPDPEPEPAVVSGPRPGTDADTGPSSPPWSRGFVEGRQITPPPPVPAAPSGDAAPDTAQDNEPDTASGAEPDNEPDAGADPVVEDERRPPSGHRRETRSPVDPDLVKRVTSVPSPGARRSCDPETEREFREARDRIAGPAVVRHSRVPEQSSRSPETSRAPERPEVSNVAEVSEVSEPAEVSVSPGPPPPARTAPARTAHGGVRAEPAGPATAVRTGRALLSVSAAEADAAGHSTGGRDEPSSPPDAPARPDAGPVGRPSPSPRVAGIGEGEQPAPRPSPRVMRSPAPVDPAPVDPAPVDPAPVDPGSVGAGPVATDPPGPVPGTPDIGPGTPDAATDPAGPEPVPTRPEPGEPEQVVAFATPSTTRPEHRPPGPARDVDVHVTDRTDRPIAGVALSVVDGAGTPTGSATTGSDGDATVRAPGAGQFLLVASGQGYQARVLPYTVADLAVRVPVTLTRSSSVRGAVRSAAGTTRAGVAVALAQDGDVVARADSGADGTYRFPDLAAGHYLLTAGGTGSTVHVPAETDVEQDVRTAGTATV